MWAMAPLVLLLNQMFNWKSAWVMDTLVIVITVDMVVFRRSCENSPHAAERCYYLNLGDPQESHALTAGASGR